MATTDLKSPVPDHVPGELVRDFDIFDFEGAKKDVHRAWQRVVENNPPVFYTPYYGGYWVVTKPELLEEIWPDGELYSSSRGIGIPPPMEGAPPMLPIERDDPIHKVMRKPLDVALSPSAVRKLSVAARELCISMIEELKPRGKCDFIADFSLKMPMELFLKLVDLPLKDRDYLVNLANTMLKSSDPDTREQTLNAMIGYLNDWIIKRSANPGDDLMSSIVTMDVEGRELTHEEKLGYLANTMFGGLDTVGGAMGFITWHLAEHPEDRQFLRDNPSALPAAVEEFVRRFALPTISRSLTRDMKLGGVDAKAGDRVMISTIAHGVNEQRWPDALEVKFDRHPTGHLAFGRGTHCCPGANLARAELRIFLEEWLTRIPDFRVPEGAEVVHAPGNVSGLKTLPLEWDV